MNGSIDFKHIGLGAIAWFLTGCASTASFGDTPQVSLRNVEVTAIDLNSQTFLLAIRRHQSEPVPAAD